MIFQLLFNINCDESRLMTRDLTVSPDLSKSTAHRTIFLEEFSGDKNWTKKDFHVLEIFLFTTNQEA